MNSDLEKPKMADSNESPMKYGLDVVKSYFLPRDEASTSQTTRPRRKKSVKIDIPNNDFDGPDDDDNDQGSVVNLAELNVNLGGKSGSLVSKKLTRSSRLALGALLLALLALVAFSVSLALLIYWNDSDGLKTSFFHFFDDETRGDHLSLAKGHGFWMFLAFIVLLPIQIFLEAICQYCKLTEGFTGLVSGVMRVLRIFCVVMGLIPLFVSKGAHVPDFSDHAVHLIISIFCLVAFVVEAGNSFVRICGWNCLEGVKLLDCFKQDFIVTFLDSTNKFYILLAVLSGFELYTLSYAEALGYLGSGEDAKSPDEISFEVMLAMVFLGFVVLYLVQVIKHYNAEHTDIITQIKYRTEFKKIADKLQARIDEKEAEKLEDVQAQ